MKKTGLFHSFARRWAREPLDVAVAKSLPYLKSVLKNGLLLVPEQVQYNHDGISIQNALSIFQLRACFTMLNETELPYHSSFFGPLSIQLSAEGGRVLGLIPTIYLPQPVSDTEQPLLDFLAHALVERISQIQVLLDELERIQKQITDSGAERCVNISIESGPYGHVFNKFDLSKLTEILTNGRHPLLDLSGAIQLLSCLFYPTDKPAHKLSSHESELFYYGQREWRMVGHILQAGMRFDEQLAPDEKSAMLTLDPVFFGQPVQLGTRMARRIDACRIVRGIGEARFADLVQKIWVPSGFFELVEKDLSEPKWIHKIVEYNPLTG